jgi:hypothetical protein
MVRSCGLGQEPQNFYFLNCISGKIIWGPSKERSLLLKNFNQEGCMRHKQMQLGTWAPNQHLLEDRKTRKTFCQVTFQINADF